MSNKINYGFKRALGEIIGGVVITTIVSGIGNAGLIPSFFIWIFHFINISGMIILIQKMHFWATYYILG